MTEKCPMLKEGFDKLEAEIKDLKYKQRPAVTDAIEVARAHGDLSENAEYHAAKEQQGHIETRIKYIESVLSRAQVIDPKSLTGDRVVFGATVTLLDEDDKEVIYQIVGADESDIKRGHISYQSPIARALITRKLNDEVEVKTPGGERYYEITKVDFK